LTQASKRNGTYLIVRHATQTPQLVEGVADAAGRECARVHVVDDGCFRARLFWRAAHQRDGVARTQAQHCLSKVAARRHLSPVYAYDTVTHLYTTDGRRVCGCHRNDLSALHLRIGTAAAVRIDEMNADLDARARQPTLRRVHNVTSLMYDKEGNNK
jgi:hypothetical protein